MKSMSINELQEVNGGYYYCRLCGYSNDSYWNVYSHCLVKESLPAAAAVLSIVKSLLELFA